jgi:branched-chain amino acid transport system permease protein
VNEIVQALVNGILLGAVYGGFAIGLSLILGVLRIVNIAHSAVLIMGALIYWQLVNGAGFDPLLMIPVVVAIGAGGGWLTHTGVARFLTREADSTVMLTFFGLMVVIESIAILIWTTDTRTLQLDYLSGTVTFFGMFNITIGRLVAAGLALAALIALHLFLTRTLTGSAIRGMAQNRDVASMVGINVTSLSRWVFTAGFAFAAFGGTVLALISPFTPQEHVRWLAWAFLVVILGGLGSAGRTLIAGFVVGVVESFVGTFLPFQYTYLVLYGLLAVVLLVKNEGLGGFKERAL